MTSCIKKRGTLFVLSAPSGAGKTSICRAILDSQLQVSLSTSVTTRSPRPGEVDGDHYYFMDLPTFEAKKKSGDFIEHAEVFGNHYGTLKKPVLTSLENGKSVLFDIDWQGMRQLKETLRDDVVSIFISPPSLEVLKERLKGRGQDSLEVIEARMEKALHEMKHWNEYDYVIINEDLERSIDAVTSIIKAETHKRIRYKGLDQFVGKMC